MSGAMNGVYADCPVALPAGVPAGFPVDLPQRSEFSFSPGGRYAMCLRREGRARTIEHWALGTERPAVRDVTGVTTTDAEIGTAPLDDGRALVLQRDTRGASPRYLVHLIRPVGYGLAPVLLGEIPAAAGCRIIPAPRPRRGRLAVAIGIDDPENSTVWRISDTAPWLVPVLRISGVLTGGVWPAEDVLALDRTDARTRTSGILVDLDRVSWEQVWSVSDRSVDRIVLASPHSGTVVVSTNASGEERLGWGRLGEDAVWFPVSLHRPGYPCRVLALDERGERLLVDEAVGAASRLVVHALGDGTAAPRPVPGRPCRVSAPATWTDDLVRVPVSAPDMPPTLATVRLGRRPGDLPQWSYGADAGSRPGSGSGSGSGSGQGSGEGSGPGGRRKWATAELVEVPGAAGPMEAVVYGGPGWWRCERLVVALHGGPLSAWVFAFDPLLQRLARAGAAVVAPNHRGSTGYGEDHLRAVVGDWGGPDLDDVLHLGRHLAGLRGSERPRPVLLGASYGGFLALLAACHESGLWSAVAALAPFVSAPSLYDGASPAVRHRVERLGGLRPPGPGDRSRDVLEVCDRLTAPLLLAHGTADATVPVQESRALYRRLLALGRRDHLDVEYVELDTDHADVALGRFEDLGETVQAFCLHHHDVRGSTWPAA